MSEKKHLIIIDGYNFVFRAYHSLPSLTGPQGEPTGAVYGFTSMLIKLINDFKPSHLVVIFDHGKKNFRHEIYPAYKANRPPAPEDLKPQFPMVREATKALNLFTLELENYEADDIIATIAKKAEAEDIRVTIVSSDKDLMQLIDNNISMYDPIKLKTIQEKEVIEKFGVKPEQILDFLSLVGDSSDNIPGVPSIGPKTAAELINQFSNLDNLFAKLPEIKQEKRRKTLEDNKNKAFLSKKLITLHYEVPINLDFASFETKDTDADELVEFMKKYGFKSLIARVSTKSYNPAPLSPSKPLNILKIESDTHLDAWLNQYNNSSKLAIFCSDNYIELAFSSDSCGYLDCNQQPEGQLTFLNLTKNEKIDSLSKIISFAKKYAILPIIHDAKTFLHLLATHQISLESFDDIMLLSYATASGIHNHNLEDLIKLYINQDFDLKNAKPGERAVYIYQLEQILHDKLAKNHLVTLYQRIEKPLTAVLVTMENIGVKVDPLKLRTLSNEFEQKLIVLEKNIFHLAGCQFNVASPKQLGEVLFKNMALPGGKLSKAGAYATGADILESLSEQGYTIADDLLEWRQISKLKNTYTDALITQIDPSTKRIHTNFSMASVVTGRLSSNDPNLQNIPIRSVEGNKIRESFIAEEGYSLVSADYSQIELRILAHIAEIDALKHAFQEKKDIHAITASQIFGIPLDQITSHDRRKAKAINFGIIYGISAFGLARNLGIDRNSASTYIKRYFKEYPGIEKYMENIKEFARKHGYVESLYGRRCYLKAINNKNAILRNFAERAAINAPMQSTAADIIKCAMINLAKHLSPRIRMILQVHDELLFEVPYNEVNEASIQIKQIMENITILSVPLIVDINHGSNWAEIH